MKQVNGAGNISNEQAYKILIIPAELVDTIKAKLGDEFIWDYDKQSNSLFLMKKPVSYTEFLSGLGKEMWDSVGGTQYIREERERWDD
jgi:hypothetical protein